jgi:NodT family efflux transporter outer membrane factor (OMF) lipoprotein
MEQRSQTHRLEARAGQVVCTATTLLLSACVVGPNFKAPPQPSASAYVSPKAAATSATAVPGGAAQRFSTGNRIAADWYRVFGSGQLNAMIAAALKDNPSLQAAQARLRQARSQLQLADSTRYPSANAGVAASRDRLNAAQLGLSSPLFVNTFALYTAQASVSYDLDLFGANRRGIEAQQANVDAERFRLRGTYLTLVSNLVVTALNAADLQDRITATNKIIAAEQDQLTLVEGLEQAGSVSHADTLRAQTQLATVKATLPALRQELAVQQTQLAILSGIDPGEFHAPLLTLVDFKLPEDLPFSLPSELVRQRPDILAAESALHFASAQVGVATANLYPQLTLSAFYGVQGNELNTLFNPPARIWSFGGSLLAPLFRGGALHAEKDAAVAAYDESFAQYRQTVLEAFGQVSNVLSAIDNDADGLQAQYAALDSARASRELVQGQYRQGAATYLDVLVAEQQSDLDELSYLSALGQRFVDTASLYQALGGGWWNAPAPGEESARAYPRAYPSSMQR